MNAATVTHHLARQGRLGVAFVVVVLPLTFSSAKAQTASDWQYTVSPYIWGAGLSGETDLANLPATEFDLSFGDILDNLDAVGLIVGNANNGRFGVSADVQYLSTRSTGTTNGDAFGDAELESTSRVYSLSGEYLLNTTPSSELWAAAGIRYWDVELQVDLEAGTSPATSSSGSNDWVDPMVGVRGRADVGERAFVAGWAYLGGFGVGSELMTDVFGGVGYEFSDRTSGVIGFRYQSVDREDGDFEYDIEQSGPIAGVTFRF